MVTEQRVFRSTNHLNRSVQISDLGISCKLKRSERNNVELKTGDGSSWVNRGSEGCSPCCWVRIERCCWVESWNPKQIGIVERFTDIYGFDENTEKDADLNKCIHRHKIVIWMDEIIHFRFCPRALLLSNFAP